MQSAAKGSSPVDIFSIVAVLPFVAVCIVAAFIQAEQSRAIALNEALGRARTAMSAVDFELRGHILTLQAMATSRSFERGDMRSIYDDCKRALGSQPAWLNVGLQSGNGTQLFNAVEPFGTLPSPQVDQDSLERALELGTPQIGNVAIGPAIDKAATRVRVPVLSQGKVRYVLSVPLKPQLFEDILREQRLPPGWGAALLDGKKRVVASVPSQSPATGLEPAPAEARRKPSPRPPEGIAPGARPDGTDIVTAYVTSSLSGWVVDITVPKDSIKAAAWRGARPIVLGVMGALAIAAFMLWLSLGRSEHRAE